MQKEKQIALLIMCREADKLSPDEVSLVLYAYVKLGAPTHAPDVFYTDVHDMLSRSLRFLADFEDFTALGVLDDDALLYLRREIHRTWESTPAPPPGCCDGGLRVCSASRKVGGEAGQYQAARRMQPYNKRRNNVPSILEVALYQGVDEYTVEVLVGLSDEFQELKKAIAAKVQVDFNDACTLYQW